MRKTTTMTMITITNITMVMRTTMNQNFVDQVETQEGQKDMVNQYCGL